MGKKEELFWSAVGWTLMFVVVVGMVLWAVCQTGCAAKTMTADDAILQIRTEAETAIAKIHATQTTTAGRDVNSGWVIIGLAILIVLSATWDHILAAIRNASKARGASGTSQNPKTPPKSTGASPGPS